MKKQCFVLFYILFALTLASCNGNNGGEDVAKGPLPQIQIFPGGQEKSLISQETIGQDNCEGSAETSQTIERSHTVLYTLELGSGIKVEADGRAKIPEIGEVGVGAEIASNYKVGYGRSESVSRSQTVAAAPQSHIQHTIQQYEIWETGEVLVVMGDLSQQLPYKFRSDFSIEIVAPANVICPGSGTGDAVAASSGNQPNENTEQPDVLADFTIPPTDAPSDNSTWHGEYFNNLNFEGEPVGIKNDVHIDFDWNEYSPLDGVNNDEFSIRWTKCLEFNEGTYTFKAKGDDNIEVFLDDVMVVSASASASGKDNLAEMSHDVTKGSHCLKVEYKDYVGFATVHFAFEETTSPLDNSTWHGEYLLVS